MRSVGVLVAMGLVLSGCGSDDPAASGAGGSAGLGGSAGSASGGSAGTGVGGNAGSGGAGGGGAGGTAGSGTGGAAGGGAGGSGGSTSGPYGHVVPADVGVTIGAGAGVPAPTTPYAGPLTITAPTTLKDVTIDGCLEIASDDVTLDNVTIDCNGLYPVKATGHKNFTLSHSTISCGSNSKVFLIDNQQSVTISKNEITGCEDFFYVNGDVDGLLVEYNYMHSLNLTPSSHADGFQIGEAATTTGAIALRGNYIDPDASGGKNDVLFATNFAENAITVEDNFFAIWGLRTLRCGGNAQCTVRTNVYAQAFENMIQPGFNGKLLFFYGSSPKTHSFECNRLADGSFVQEMEGGVDRVAGATHVTTGCPAFP